MQHALKVKEKTEENTKQSDLIETHQESYSCDNPLQRQVIAGQHTILMPFYFVNDQ